MINSKKIIATYRNCLNDVYTVTCTGKGFKVDIAQSDGVNIVKRYPNRDALDKFLVKRKLI